MNRTCYLLGWMNSDNKLVSIGMFSEPSPTQVGSGYWVKLGETDGATYAVACQEMRAALSYPHSFPGQRYWAKLPGRL